MKKVYWRPPGVSRTALVLIACAALAVLVAVESFRVERKQRHYGEKVAASRLAEACMDAIKAEKQRRNLLADQEIDPAQTGMIGESVTLVTSNTGHLDSKLTSANPNFAAVVVHQLFSAGVGEGDRVAVGVTGSFPALNVAAYAAFETLRLVPIVIASVASSEWGANHVDYLWPDMEHTLRTHQLIGFGSAVGSHWGIDDRDVGITDDGRALIDAAITRHQLTRLVPKSLADSIEQRMVLYDELAGDRTIKAYINIGGGSASVGTHVGRKPFKAPPRGVNFADSVMLRFARRGIPVIHISRIKLLAERYGLPIAPKTKVPIGQGKIYVKEEYNLWLVVAGLVLIIGIMLAFLRWDVGTRLLRRRLPHGSGHPSP